MVNLDILASLPGSELDKGLLSKFLKVIYSFKQESSLNGWQEDT